MPAQTAHDDFQGRSEALQSEIQQLDKTIQVANESAQREAVVFTKVRCRRGCC